MKKVILCLIILVVILLPLCSAEHNITGIVNDAKDGMGADGHSILLWNPLVGMQDNLTDIIGITGNSSLANHYTIDCELLNTPCALDDILTVKVIDNGDNYVSEEKNVTVTSSSEDSVEDITLNSVPTVELIFPVDFGNLSNSQFDFNCSFSDLDDNLDNISLYGNWTGDWILNETKDISSGEGFKIFTKIISEGFYVYNCEATDNLSVSAFSPQNNSFTVDLTDPNIDSVFVNITSSCGHSDSVRVNCTTYDDLLKIDKVIIQASSPSGKTNYSASLLTGDTYYSDILLDETGIWNFTCISNDSAGNVNTLTSENVQVHSDLPELFVNFLTINLSESDPFENQSVKINAVVENLGCSDAENVLVGFFEGDPDVSGENIDNVTINISQLSYNQTNVSWNAKIGATNIFVFADYDLQINEENESNNKANRTLSVNAWQEIYGNTSVNKIIGNATNNISKWFNETSLEGNIFVTDSESSINWLSLQAIGKTKDGGDSSNDFLEIDELLNMTSYEDSVSNVFSDNQIPKNTQDILVHQKEILGVPIINSTNNSNFTTGILWDTSGDTQGANGEFDSGDKESIVFIARINRDSLGAYGTYDYEIKVPSKLREFDPLDTQEIYLYYDLN